MVTEAPGTARQAVTFLFPACLLQPSIWHVFPKFPDLAVGREPERVGLPPALSPVPWLVLSKVRPVTPCTLSKGPVRLPPPGRALCPRLLSCPKCMPSARL